MSTVVRIQIKSKVDGAGVTSKAITLTNPVIVGNTIIVVVNDNYGVINQVSSMTDNLGNTYTRRTSATDGSFVDGEIWSAPVTVAGSCTITANFSHTVDCGLMAMEYAGLGIVDKVAAVSSIGLTHSSGNTAATTQANELVFGACVTNDVSNKFKAGSGFGNLSYATDVTRGISIGVQNKLVTATGAQSSSMSTSGTDHGVSMCVTFKTATIPPNNGIAIFINGIEKTADIDWESNFSFNSVLTKEVSTLQFSIKLSTSKTIPALGDQIDVYEDQTLNLGVHIFGGTVTETETSVIGGILLGLLVTATDWSYKLNGKLVVKNYSAMDPQAVVQDIISTFTTGFTTNNVSLAGYNIGTISFNYEQVTGALERLAKMIGWEWYVDADKDVHFFPPGTSNPAPFGVDDTSGNQWWQTIDVDQNLQNMKNSVFVLGGNYTKTYDASTTPDKYTTDGVKTVFQLAYPYDPAVISVTLDGVAQTVAVITNPGSAQVLYSQSGKFIQFAAVPVTGKTVKIFGNAVVPIAAHSINQTAIAAYTEKQDVIIDKTISSTAEAQDRADAEIARYSVPVFSLKFTTINTGLQVGQTIQFNSTKFNLSASVVVSRITGKLRTPSQMVYQIECVSTDSVTFINIMKVLMQQQNALNPANPSSVLQVFIGFMESLRLTDSTTVTTSTGPYVWGTMKWGYFTWH